MLPRNRGLRTAHPRSRGENLVGGGFGGHGVGSSPLTRGKLGLVLHGLGGLGLIPAHAGKTTPPSTNSEPLRAHPRSRGENTTVSIAASTLGGSSPLTRGKHLFLFRIT